MTEWVHLYDSDSGETQSSWIRSFAWTPESENSESGVFILRRYDSNPEQIDGTYRYEGVPKDTFEELRSAASNNKSVGSLVNSRIIKNPDIPEAKSR